MTATETKPNSTTLLLPVHLKHTTPIKYKTLGNSFLKKQNQIYQSTKINLSAIDTHYLDMFIDKVVLPKNVANKIQNMAIMPLFCPIII